MLKSLFLAALLSVSVAATASATTVFSDDFNYGTATRTSAKDRVFGGNWVTTAGTVDYLTSGGRFADLCRNTGNCVDLDGSTGDAGLFSTVQSFAAGTYLLSIGLFGSLRDTTEAVTITLGSWSMTISGILSGADASRTVRVTTTGGVLSFQNDGNDNTGALLTSVNLATLPPESSRVAAVPLPAGGVLLLGALAGLAGLRRRLRTA